MWLRCFMTFLLHLRQHEHNSVTEESVLHLTIKVWWDSVNIWWLDDIFRASLLSDCSTLTAKSFRFWTFTDICICTCDHSSLSSCCSSSLSSFLWHWAWTFVWNLHSEELTLVICVLLTFVWLSFHCQHIS